MEFEQTPAGRREAADTFAMDKHFANTHKELPWGRNFRCFNREKDVVADRKYRANFDKIFPNAPGAGF